MTLLQKEFKTHVLDFYKVTFQGPFFFSSSLFPIVIESDADHADDRWCTNDAKLAWVDLPSNAARYYLLLFNIGCVAVAWE